MEPVELQVLELPVAEPVEIDDLIIVFPIDSGMAPIYVMYVSPRYLPGVVTGQGLEAGPGWMAAAADEGARIPLQIGDLLLGKTYSSFDTFRQAIWRNIANHPELSKAFTAADLKRMARGAAPSATYSETVGSREAYEIHHTVPIKQGGGVYDLSNFMILTPKQHIIKHKKREKRHLSRKLEDYTENEFLEFVTDIYEMNTKSDREHRKWMREFANLVQHPRGWDLIFRYIDGIDNTPTGIVAYIKKWRAENNLPGFKEQ